MPLPTVATYARVAAAAEALERELGREPTVDEVLSRTGGSKTTVTRELAKWRELRTQPPQLPDELRAQLTAVLEPVLPQLWALAQQHAAAQHAEAERAAQAQIAQLTQDLEQADADLDSAQKALADTQARLAAIEPELQRLISAAADAQRQAAAHEAMVTLLKPQLEAALARVDEQAEAVQQAQAELREHIRLQGEQAGELTALRRQLQQQQTLIERLTARPVETPSPAAPAEPAPEQPATSRRPRKS